jgi:L-fuconolactonase
MSQQPPGNSVDETLELDRRAGTDGHPDAVVGGLPLTDSVAEAVAVLDRLLAAPPLPRRSSDRRLR